ncbi:MAG: cupin domain-containing protein [Candidatus Methanoperedens sp.]|nr:cupin domain-containing protein [Candidatus Methanoperedens nitroreducens]MDJ1421588.1 cupin domain-containing protein [Candidatus Methanoperedens sp.]
MVNKIYAEEIISILDTGRRLNMIEMKDALQTAPTVYTLLMENDRVRVLDVRVKPGEKVAMHAHPDHVAYVLGGQRLKFTSKDGKSKEYELKAGQVLWIEAGPHSVENISKVEAHVIMVELKPLIRPEIL